MTPEQRKQRPVYSGVIAYFPDAIKEVAYASWIGNQQHCKGKPLQWDRSKSTDDPDAAMRHITDRASGEVFDTDGCRHLAKAAWRILATLQKEIENEKEN